MIVMLPTITILIPTKNVAPYIDQVLRSIFNLDYPKELFDVWILDGFSTDGTKEIAKKYPVVFRESARNVPAFYNLVMSEIKGDIVALGDGDAIVDTQWLKTLVSHFDDPRVAGAGGLCLTANPERIVPRVIGYELKARYEVMPESISRIATMNVLYRKSALLEVGGFDERFDTGYDTDIGHRICSAGYTIHFDPKAIVYHYNRPTLRSYYRQQFTYGKNTAKLYLQHLHIAAGDEVTPFWMNVQPFIYVVIVLALFAGFIFSPAYILGVLLLAGLLVSYFVSAARLSIRERDASALFFVVLCFIRGAAWTIGGGWYAITSLANSRSR
jgi:cellulose synthase/poly-beta-1,6-N-acetylglucosamine synthase-like glycosyltransferase